MHEIFNDYTDQIEPLSLDEAFLDVSDCPQCRGSATLIADEIRQRIADTIGITVSAGIAPNKFIAKIASDLNKPNGQYVVTPQQVDGFLQDLPVNRIWGVGKVTTERLQQQGIKTCADVRAYDIFQFVQKFGQFGDHIHKLAHGIDNRPVNSEWRRKSVSVENTYDQDLPDLASCLQKLPALLESLQPRLQRLDGDYRIQNCFLKMKFYDFSQTTIERQQTSPNLDDYGMLCEEAWQRGAVPVRLLGLGVRLIDLTDASGQMDLFEDSPI
jgi:DNA polymerase-4